MFTRRTRRPRGSSSRPWPIPALLTLLLLPACTSQRVQEPPPPPTGPGPLTSPSPAVPPERGPQTQPVPGSAPPARTPRVESVEDIPPPPAAQGTGPRASADAPAAAPPRGLREVFPHIRIDPDAKIVEFDAAVAWDVHDPQTPMTFLELAVCTPNTKEYESLLVTQARPSNVHAALLLLGLEPGKPGTYVWKDDKVQPVDPTGPPLDVRFILGRGSADEREIDPRTWVVNADDPKQTFGADWQAAPGRGNGWVFAGSRIVRRDVGRGEQDFYLADGDDGSLVGLMTFGSETIAWRRTISPDSEITAPEWIANVAAMPPVGTPVIVRITPAQPPAAPETAPADVPSAR